MKAWLMAILVVGAWGTAGAQELLTFKTRDGIDYKDVKLVRVEPSGLQLMTEDGIERVPFARLTEEMQKRYGYDPAKGAAFEEATARAKAEQIARNRALASQEEARKARRSAEEQVAMAEYHQDKFVTANLPTITVLAIFRPTYFGEDSTSGEFQIVQQVQTGQEQQSLNIVPTYSYQVVSRTYGVLAEAMPEGVQRNEKLPLVLYKIGHTKDSSREPLFTTSKEKAGKYLMTQQPAK